MIDRFGRYYADMNSPGLDGFMVGAANTANVFPQPTRALYVGVTGNVEVMMVGSTSSNTSNTILLLQAVPAGETLPLRVKAICGNTTATGLVGLY